MESNIVIRYSTITGIHRTMVSAHEDVALAVEVDNTIPQIDPQCMRVMFPMMVADRLHDEVTWPKNSKHKRYHNQLVKDCLGKKVGNVPANLAGFFRRLLLSNYVSNITCFSTGLKPRPSTRPPTMAKFRKSWNGLKDRRGGGLVLDCRYQINLTDPKYRQYVLDEVQVFISHYDGDEEIK